MRVRHALMMLVGMTLALVPARDSRPGEAPSNERLQKVKQVIEQAIDWYGVFPDADTQVRLHPQIVLRWQNPVRIQTGAAVLAVWTDHGRPAAMASIFEWEGEICHEFGLLTRSSTVVARDQSGVIWSPSRAGVEFKDVPEAPAPAANLAGRLRQMKAVAERFTARLSDRNGAAKREVLRLLPKPLYRYELEHATQSDPVLRDGAMFAFAMGTDPEVVLLLEAVVRNDKAVWQFAFTRATGWGAEASLGDRLVWSVDPDPVSRDPKRTQLQVRRPLP